MHEQFIVNSQQVIKQDKRRQKHEDVTTGTLVFFTDKSAHADKNYVYHFQGCVEERKGRSYLVRNVDCPQEPAVWLNKKLVT